MANRCGFEIINMFCDSTSMQFWASEQYKRGIPLMDPRSYAVNPKKTIFNKTQIKNFKKEAEKLNLEGTGDTVSAVLKKVKK